MSSAARRDEHRKRGIYCNKSCRADYERKGRDRPARYRQAGYWMLRWNEGGRYRHKFEHVKVWEDANGPVPPGYEVHHRDEDRGNNALDNLQILSKSDHRKHHKLKHASDAERLAAGREAARRFRQRRRAQGR